MLTNKQKDLLPITIIVLVGFFCSLVPLLKSGIFTARDLLSFYLEAGPHFASQFWSGEFYPRWILDANEGLGSPALYFQGPLPFYINSLFALIFRDRLGWIPLVMTAGLAFILSGITSFVWLKESTNRSIAIFGSIIYMILPYHLAVDLYYRFNLAEIWAFVWLPLLLYFVLKILQKKSFSLLYYGLSFAALILTQPSVALIFAIVPIGYAIVLSYEKWKTLLLKLLAGMLIGLGLSAIYWYPALLMQNNISLSKSKEFNYSSNFIFRIPNNILDTELWKYLEVTTILMVIVAGCAWAIARFSEKKKYSAESYYWFTIALLAGLMSTPISYPIWAILPPLQSIILPWIFNVVLVVASTALISLAIFATANPLMVFIDKPVKIVIFSATILVLSLIEILPLHSYFSGLPRMNNTLLAILLVLLVVIAVTFIKQVVDFSHYRVLVVEILLITSLLLSSVAVITQVISRKPHNINQATILSQNPTAYRTRWTSPEFFTRGHLKTNPKMQGKAELITGEGSVHVNTWKPGKIILEVEAQSDSLLKVNQFYYPNWVASIVNNNRVKQESIHPSGNEGLLQLSVPSGSSRIRLQLQVSSLEKTGQLISFLSLLGILGWIVYHYYWLVPAVYKTKSVKR